MAKAEAVRRPVRGGLLIAVAMGVMNAAAYGYTIVAARLLGPVPYGGFAAVMNLLLVVSVVSLGLQATAARRISAERELVGQIERGVLRVTWVAAVGTGAALVTASPVVERLLRLDSPTTAVLLGLTAVPVTAMGGQAGVLQGERRWGALAAVYVAAGVPRLAIGTSLLLWRPTEQTAVLAVAVAAVAPVAVGWWVLRPERTPGSLSEQHRGRRILGETVVNSQALLAFFALSNLDIVVARNVLTAEDAGLYAGGLILTKAVLFLPQFVVVVAFPSMSAVGGHLPALLRGLGVIVVLGAVGTLGCRLLPELALVFIGGPEFAAIADRLWQFCLLGTVLAMLNILVYSVLARQGRRTSALLWLGLVAMVLVGATAETVSGLVLRVVAVDTVLLLALLVSTAWSLGRDRRRP